MAFSLSSFVIVVKKHLNNISVSDEEILNSLLKPLVEEFDIKDKNGNVFYLNKQRVSRIINHRDDVPQVIRNTLERYNINDVLNEGMECFINDYFEEDVMTEVNRELISLIGSDSEYLYRKYSSADKYESADLFAGLLFDALKQNNKLNNKSRLELFRNGTHSFNVICGDIFKYGYENRKRGSNIVVIPVNSAFDTHITRKYEDEMYPLVSENTIHGKWLDRWVKSGHDIEDLDLRILRNLKQQGVEPLCAVIDGVERRKEYSLGTISVIQTDDAIYYLLAISVFDEHNNAHVTPDQLEAILIRLLEFYDRHGQGIPLYFPLIGTGLSRAGLSYQESYDLIKSTILENAENIHGSINLVLQRDTYNDIMK